MSSYKIWIDDTIGQWVPWASNILSQRPLAWWERVLGFAAGATLIMAMPITDEIGFGIGILLLAQHIVRARRAGPVLA